MEADELTTRFITALRGVGTNVVVDLTDEPPSIVGRTAQGRVFVAAWPDDDMLLVRLRLEAMSSAPVVEMQQVEEGSLTYEVGIRSADEIESLVAMFERAHAFANQRDG